MDIDQLVQIALSDPMQFVINVVNAVYNVSVHISGYCMGEDQRDHDQARGQHKGDPWDPLIKLVEWDHASNIVIVDFFKNAIGFYSIDDCVMAGLIIRQAV